MGTLARWLERFTMTYRAHIIILQNCLSLSLAFAGLSVLSRKPTVFWVSALVHTLRLRIMAKETRKQLPFDRDAVNENLAWRIPLVLRICVQYRCSLAIRATRNQIFAVSFLVSWKQLSIWLTTWNWQTQHTHRQLIPLMNWISYTWMRKGWPSWLNSC